MKEVIYKHNPKYPKHPLMSRPKDGDKVVVYQCERYSHCYNIVGYECAPNGTRQSFRKVHFIEPNFTNELTKELAESYKELDRLEIQEKEIA
jgi:hypothetical protein